MAISDNYVPLRQLGNGVTTQFSSNWDVLDQTYIEVFLESVSTGVQVPQTLGVDFTLVFSSAGFTVTFAVAPTNANYVVIGRDVTIDQTNPYTTSKGFQGAVLEDSLDKLTAITQDLRDITNRSLTAPLGDTATLSLPSATLRATRVLAFDASGNVIVSDQTLAQIEAGSTAAAASAAAAAASAATASSAATSASGSATSASASATSAAASSLSVKYFYGTVGGTANAITLNSGQALSTLTQGMRFRFLAGANNTLTNPTIAVDTATAGTIVKDLGAGNGALAPSDIQSGETTELMYLGSNFFQLLNPHAPYILTATPNTASLQAANMQAVQNSAQGGGRNKIRNGALNDWQRTTSGTVTAGSPAYTADGMIVSCAGANVTWSQQAQRASAPFCLRVTGNTSVTGMTIKQRIESILAAQLYPTTGAQVTVQVKVFNNTGGSITPQLSVNHANSSDNFGAVTQDLAPVNMQACPNAALTQLAYTFQTAANTPNGLEAVLDFGNNFSANTKFIEITEWDISVTPGVATGINANPPLPEIRVGSNEKAINQRYYFSSGAGQQYIAWSGQTISATSYTGDQRYPVTMRASPTIVLTQISSANFPTTVGTPSGGTDFVQESRTANATGNGSFFQSSVTASAEL